MHIQTACSDTLPQTLANSVFGDRSAQFIGRLGWNLCATPEGLECDEYDLGGSTYIVAAEGDRHLGSCRLRHVSSGTMIEDHFLDHFPVAAGFLRQQSGHLYELTRFCRSPALSVSDSQRVLRELATALDRFKDRAGATGFLAVVFAPIARMLKRAGVRYLTIDTSEMDGKPVLLICIVNVEIARRSANINEVPAEAHPVRLAVNCGRSGYLPAPFALQGSPH